MHEDLNIIEKLYYCYSTAVYAEVMQVWYMARHVVLYCIVPLIKPRSERI